MNSATQTKQASITVRGRCDYVGDAGACKSPAVYRGMFVHPAGERFVRCGSHLGHLSPREKRIGKRWMKFEHPLDRADRRQLEKSMK